jgi:poly-gamma-glutamate capsule biosynthesis protein CapA/YwtB (metallophosphatase superfamily)
MDELRAAAQGQGSRRLIVPTEDAQVITDALGGAPDTGSLEEIEAAVKDGALGLVRASDVSQRVHALALGGASLFGIDRVRSVEEWPLTLGVSAQAAWDPATLWTLAAGGDVMMDRGVAFAVKNQGGNGDYLFDGGTADITRIKCCSYYGFDYPVIQRTGNRGAVRDFFKSADIAIANLESAVLVDAPYHPAGFTFTADASLLDAVDRAGFDFLSLGNNHVRNAAARGIRTAREQLDMRGIAYSGSGREDEAGKPGYVDTPTGLRVAVIGCDAIVASWTATPEKVGTFNCKKSDVAGRIREIRDTADVVIVFPHWGREYKPTPAPYQRKLAEDWIDAGADLIIGAHSHIAGAMDDIDGRTVFYSLGNLIFDQDFRQSTMMGVIPEMTFDGDRLVQIQLHPTLITDAQPNFANDRDGQFVIDQMRDGSDGLLPY